MVFFFEQKQTERVVGNRSPGCLSGPPRSGRIWLLETLGPQFPACPAALLFRPRLPPAALCKPWSARGTGSPSGKIGRSLARCGNWPEAFWEAMLGRGGGWASPAAFNPFGASRLGAAWRVRVGIESCQLHSRLPLWASPRLRCSDTSRR